MTIKESELALFQFQQRRRANIGRVLPTKGGGVGGRRATEETVKLKMIRAVVKLWTQFMQLRKKPEKNSGLQRDLNPWALDTDAKL